MRVMIAEYAVGSRDERRRSLLREGEAMLNALKKSFENLGHEVVSPYEEADFAFAVEKLSKNSDAGIVIAPDDMLADLTVIVEENTLNLGCPSEAVRTCADKLRTTEILREKGIPAPDIVAARGTHGNDDAHGDTMIRGGRFVIKPRYGCGSEGVFIVRDARDVVLSSDSILTTHVEGDDVSVSMVASASGALLLTVNKQHLRRVTDADDVRKMQRCRDGRTICERLIFEGCSVPYAVGARWERTLKQLSERTARILGCRGYFGIDFVLGNDGTAYVVDVNPRATTAIVCVANVLDVEIAEIILRAARDELPSEARVHGTCTFRL